MVVHAVPMIVRLPAGLAGPEPLELDVRAFLVAHPDGLVLVDTGLDAEPTAVADALTTLGADWSDVSDVLLTHPHPDHVGGLARVRVLAPGATVWASPLDAYEGPCQPLDEGTTVRGLEVLALPGHTPGHVGLVHADGVFAADAAGVVGGRLVRPPAPFTADPVRAEASLRRLVDLAPGRVLFSHGAEVDEPVAALRALLASG